MFGFINAFKPPGLTSTAFGTFVRRLLNGSPVGHWGTLDPQACGVLVLAAGDATRLLPLLTPTTKRYAFELNLGRATDTADAFGRTIAEGPLPDDWRSRLPEVLGGLVGPIEQVPPMFSAVKVAGRPLYVSARKGGTVARTPRQTRVLELRLLSTADRSARLGVECEAGLYVRTLCEQIGERLGVPAHMGALVRTAAGPFAIARSSTPAEIAAEAQRCLIDPLAVLTQPRIGLDAANAKRFSHGNAVRFDERDVTQDTPVTTGDKRPMELLVLLSGRLIGTGLLVRANGSVSLTPTRVISGNDRT